MHIIVYTDIGEDVDDVLALRYLEQCEAVTSISIVLSSHKHEIRKQTWELCARYMKKVDFVWHDTNGSDDEALCMHLQKLQCPQSTESDMRVLCIGPMTEYARHCKDAILPLDCITRHVIQSNLTTNQPIRTASDDSLNTRVDIDAATYISTQSFHSYRVSKYAAYTTGLTQTWFDTISHYDHRRGPYLTQQAQKRQQEFHDTNNPTYQRVYGTSPGIISFPYDLLAAMHCVDKTYTAWKTLGNHAIIGDTEDRKIKHETMYRSWFERSLCNAVGYKLTL